MNFEQMCERTKAKLIALCGRAEDLRTSDVHKYFPARELKTIQNDIGKKKLPVAKKQGKFLLFTYKEVTIYEMNLGGLNAN